METVHLLDAKGLALFKRITAPTPPPTTGRLAAAYLDLETRIYNRMYDTAEPGDSFASLVTILEAEDPDWLGYLRRGEGGNPPIPLVTGEIVDLVLRAYGVESFSEEIYDEIGIWGRTPAVCDELIMGFPRADFRDSAAAVVRDTMPLSVERDYLRYQAEGCHNRARELFTFSERRSPFSFMRFPDDHPGYTPEVGLATTALSTLGDQYGGNYLDSEVLMDEVAQYIARTTLCSAGDIVSPVGRWPTADRPFSELDAGGVKRMYNLIQLRREGLWYNRGVIRRLGVSEREALRADSTWREAYLRITDT